MVFSELVVAMSGKVDYVSDGRTVFAIQNGSHWQENITGSGCMASSCVLSLLLLSPLRLETHFADFVLLLAFSFCAERLRCLLD
jgi:hydroxyethylthiazole kinase-like sugar kinase family protein